VEKEHAPIGLGWRKADVEYGIQTFVQVCRAAIESHAWDLLLQFFYEVAFNLLDMAAVCGKFLEGNFQCFSQTDNANHIFSSSPHVALLRTAMDERVNFFVFPDIEESDSFGSVKLMCTGHQGVHRKLRQVMGIMAHRLYRVRVAEGIVSTRKGSYSL